MGMMNTGIKRARESEFDNITNMANWLMLLSRAREFEALNIVSNNNNNNNNSNPSRVFECKTCNKQFPSFQALGGHRASHKRPKLGGGESHLQTSPPKPKTHECSICGLEFAVGQALGGHMRRHRASHESPAVSSSTSVLSGSSDDHTAVKNSKSGSRRAWCLDLNLTPFENNLVMAPAVDLFL
ncbi:hypothetical protein ACH5RR_016612 [Cinchona calisaya]|uniref:C2H2-type domain-containing protein n=1 Tax=Cinchona calisaya TaxID=153742 RepID=A0ABD2ZXM0_9GENT